MRNELFRKSLVCAILVLFVGMTISTSTGDIKIEKEPSVVLNCDQGCYPVINGTMGENGWYVSCVTITFVYDPEVIADVHYKIDIGSWQIYTEPFVICEDGLHTIYYYAVDMDGNPGPVQEAEFKIDQTPPIIELTVEKIGDNMWLFIADVFDETSGVNRVEFYLDGELLGTVTESPFEWEWSGTGSHTVQAVVFDNAGNSAQDEKPVSHSQNQHSSTPLFFQILERLLGIGFRRR